MEIREVKVLLQRFYEGLSTQEEEARLVSYFIENEVDDDLLADQELFAGLAELNEEVMEVPSDLQQSILTKLEPLQKEPKGRRIALPGWYAVASIAASVVIIVSALFFLNRKPDLGSFENPAMAYAETKEALELVSKYFGKGTEQIGNLEKIQTPQKSLEHLKSFDQGIEQTRGLLDIGKK